MPLVRATLQRNLEKGVDSIDPNFQTRLEDSLLKAYKKINEESSKQIKPGENKTVNIQEITAKYISEAVSQEVSDTLKRWAETIAFEVDTFVKSGDVNTTVTTSVNTVVATTGTAVAQTGKGTGSGAGSGTGKVT